MEITKVDPRVLRTRRLLIASFITVTQVKEFKDITIQMKQPLIAQRLMLISLINTICSMLLYQKK
ncbi:hypothetical protein [Peribacillus butanolivorans]